MIRNNDMKLVAEKWQIHWNSIYFSKNVQEIKLQKQECLLVEF
jgi:hypothetical protein